MSIGIAISVKSSQEILVNSDINERKKTIKNNNMKATPAIVVL